MKIDCPIYATTVTAHGGKTYHPAIQQGINKPYYWQKFEYGTEQEAYDHACMIVSEFYQEICMVTNTWNCVQL